MIGVLWKAEIGTHLSTHKDKWCEVMQGECHVITEIDFGVMQLHAKHRIAGHHQKLE